MTDIASHPSFDPRQVVIDYTNWRNERGLRTILPVRIWWGSTEWHPEPQHLLRALDVEKGNERDFALADIHSWVPASLPPAGA